MAIRNFQKARGVPPGKMGSFVRRRGGKKAQEVAEEVEEPAVAEVEVESEEETEESKELPIGLKLMDHTGKGGEFVAEEGDIVFLDEDEETWEDDGD